MRKHARNKLTYVGVICPQDSVDYMLKALQHIIFNNDRKDFFYINIDLGNALDELKSLLEDLLYRWQKLDGSFRTSRLILSWNNVPYHRWAQSQTFRILSFWYFNQTRDYIRNKDR